MDDDLPQYPFWVACNLKDSVLTYTIIRMLWCGSGSVMCMRNIYVVCLHCCALSIHSFIHIFSFQLENIMEMFEYGVSPFTCLNEDDWGSFCSLFGRKECSSLFHKLLALISIETLLTKDIENKALVADGFDIHDTEGKGKKKKRKEKRGGGKVNDFDFV